MSKLPNIPPDNIFAIDLNPYKAFLVDLPPRAMVGMRREHDGWAAVQHEIVTNQPVYGDRAGITKSDFDRFVALNDQHGQILTQLPPVTKAVEVLTESLAHVDHQRHRLATQIAHSAESHAAAEGGDPTLRTAYEKTIAYRSVIADKAVRTRQKNEETTASAGEATEPGAPADGGTPAETEGAAETTEGTGQPGQGISRMPNPAPDNIFSIDLNPLKAFLVDLPAGAMRGMRQEQAGWEDVRQEIIANQAKYGDRAGITKTDFDRFVALNDQYAQILAMLPLVEKAAEVLTESLAHADNLRHKLATQFANSAESHAGSEADPTLRTAYEKTIAYRSVIADKAVKARKK
jgi:hypothetical protein